MTRYAIIAALLLSGCATPGEPATVVKTVRVPVEVQRPCPGTPPKRPAPLGETSADPVVALAQVAAKLAEYSAAGMYADKADAIMARCLGEF